MSATPARPLPSAVRDKLGKLLPMLSSDHDGERVGAVAAIERVLKSHDRDWHDLAASIGATVSTREAPRRHTHDAGASTRMNPGDLIDLIAMVRDSGTWGHVAIVAKVTKTRFLIEEYNHDVSHGYGQRWIARAPNADWSHFIHFRQ